MELYPPLLQDTAEIRWKQPATAESWVDVAAVEDGDEVTPVSAAWFIARLVLWYLTNQTVHVYVQCTIISSTILHTYLPTYLSVLSCSTISNFTSRWTCPACSIVETVSIAELHLKAVENILQRQQGPVHGRSSSLHWYQPPPPPSSSSSIEQSAHQKSEGAKNLTMRLSIHGGMARLSCPVRNHLSQYWECSYLFTEGWPSWVAL